MTSEPSTWIETHGDRLFRYALSRIRDERAAEDLVSDTLLAALKCRDQFQGNSSELTWMIGILRNKIFELLRKQSREAPLESGEEDRENALFETDGHWQAKVAPKDWGSEPLRNIENKELANILQECLKALTPNVARAFVLREMEGESANTCADIIGVEAQHLAVLLYRARIRLRRCLEKNYFTAEAA